MSSEAAISVAFVPDGKRLPAGGYEKTIRLRDTAAGKEVRVLKGHSAHYEIVLSATLWSGATVV